METGSRPIMYNLGQFTMGQETMIKNESILKKITFIFFLSEKLWNFFKFVFASILRQLQHLILHHLGICSIPSGYPVFAIISLCYEDSTVNLDWNLYLKNLKFQNCRILIPKKDFKSCWSQLSKKHFIRDLKITFVLEPSTKTLCTGTLGQCDTGTI